MKHDLPGGGWVEVKDPDSLTGADQDAYFDKYDEIMAAKPQPAPRPDPSNPAVMLEAPRPRLTNADGRVLRDWLLEMAVVSWSLDEPLPLTPEVRRGLPVRVCNALYEAVKGLDEALSGTEAEAEGAPKEGAPTGTGGSSGTSEDGTGSPLPGPAGVMSGTP